MAPVPRGGLAAGVSSNMSLYSHGCGLNTMSLPAYSGLCLPGAHLLGTRMFVMILNLFGTTFENCSLT